MTCAVCGRPLRPGAAFCGGCGSPVPTAQPPVSVIAPPAAVQAAADADDETLVIPRRRTATSWRVTLSDGTTVALRSTTLVGRAPAALPAWPGAALLAVTDPAMSVSKTHAALELDGTRLFVNDLGSTNGITVTASDATATNLQPHQRVELASGSAVELGSLRLHVEKK